MGLVYRNTGTSLDGDDLVSCHLLSRTTRLVGELVGEQMKIVQYKNHNLAHNSEAYRLWEAWKKSGDNSDRAKLDAHLKDVERRYNELVTK
jgi:hypothetical protein